MENLISIIISVYNVENLLDKCLHTVTGQTYGSLEIILIDDGSTDASGRICDEWAKKDSRICVLHKVNEGLAKARNDALKIANGDFIGFVDPDDWIDNNMFEVLLSTLKKYSADIVICGFEEVLNGVKKDKISNGFRIYNRQEALRELILDKDMQSYCWNKLFRKECMVENPFPAVKRISDLCGMHKFFQKAKTVVHLNRKLYHYIRRENGLVTVDGKIETAIDYCIAQQYRYDDLLLEEEEIRSEIQKRYLAVLESVQRIFYAYFKETGANIENCLYKIDTIILPFYLKHIEDLRQLKKFTAKKENGLTAFLKKPVQSKKRHDYNVKEINALKKQNDKNIKEIKNLRKNIADLRSSISFKIGRIITAIPRKIRDMIK